ncbi:MULTISPECIES: acetolactate synthase large subunit [unclassified Mycobacterium]|uniref:acetolactate synthase large subunit n=1 Tax=unclassified Mycobacterium TaxID=2642494 RepID=UPI0029C78FEF|nr:MULTISPECIES: acetolactate synthase large subunit [unclassified Mycobacterium]
MTTGARAVIGALLDGGVEVCFANPGTSEMHFVAALDDAPAMRAILCLFEGVATGAADGYARVAGKPAATLLHLGPGLANGLANLHNARRAHSPVINVVGDHATHHQPFDAPLQSDIAALADWVQGSVHRPSSVAELDGALAEAIGSAVGPAGRIATLILPADLSWSPATAGPTAPLPLVAEDGRGGLDVDAAADMLRTNGEHAVLLIGGQATSRAGLAAAARISTATGATALVETFPAKLARGGGLPDIERLGYLAEHAEQQLSGATHLILAGARSPVAFFAYPDKASDLLPAGATVHTLAASTSDQVVSALDELADRLGAPDLPDLATARPSLPSGPLTQQNWARVIGALLPDDAIISDEANTSGLFLAAATAASPAHDVLTLTGGAIGQGLPVAIGAAVAAPRRPVIALQADGSAVYTISALWTMARERLDITTVILNNHAYAILGLELQRVGTTTSGARARSLLRLSDPELDFVAIAEGFGVPATRASTAGELAAQFSAALREPGPHLIDASVPGPW